MPEYIVKITQQVYARDIADAFHKAWDIILSKPRRVAKIYSFDDGTHYSVLPDGSKVNLDDLDRRNI